MAGNAKKPKLTKEERLARSKQRKKRSDIIYSVVFISLIVIAVLSVIFVPKLIKSNGNNGENVNRKPWSIEYECLKFDNAPKYDSYDFLPEFVDYLEGYTEYIGEHEECYRVSEPDAKSGSVKSRKLENDYTGEAVEFYQFATIDEARSFYKSHFNEKKFTLSSPENSIFRMGTLVAVGDSTVMSLFLNMNYLGTTETDIDTNIRNMIKRAEQN